MATYMEPCRHCGRLIERDSRFCPGCGSRAPFADICPSCLGRIGRGDALCACCGRELYISCPKCGGRTFVGDKCDLCGESLLKKCPNPRCGELQFFENVKCTACGKKI